MRNKINRGDCLFDFKSLASFIPERLYNALLSADSDIASRITELRIRKNSFVIVVIRNTSFFIDGSGELCDSPYSKALKISKNEFDKAFMEICEYSVHSKLEQLKKGFITLNCGARVGVAATAVYEADRLVSIKNANSINVRIPGEAKGCAEGVLNFLYINSFPSIIVAGAPNSGKTTLLRDIARRLSSGFNNRYRKIAVIDERGELGGFGGHKLDLGINTDVLSGYEKVRGIELASRTLSPEMIICDEVSNINEVRSICYGFESGVSFALSVHASSLNELKRKAVVRELLATGEFSYIVLLDGYTYKPEIIEASEVLDEACGNDSSCSFNNGRRSLCIR